MISPVLLAADNFTPPSRTPWGGTRILDHYKADLGIESRGVVGESWEISVEPSFPSRLRGNDITLRDAIASDRSAWLGTRDAARHGQCPLLVKLLDAAQNLSVQVHPADDDAALGADESGKPESWVVLDAVPGSGLHLGFRDGVTRHDVAACIADEGALDELMVFVPVQPGDAFVIEAGTPHAIGAGVTLLEPQHVTPGRHGLTYRYWDWNRRYDGAGKLAPTGAPRELHIDRSLAVTRWDGPRGDAFVATCRSTPVPLSQGSLAHHRVIAWKWFEVDRLEGSGRLELEANRLLALTNVKGCVTVVTPTGELVLRRGESAVVPAAMVSVTVLADDAQLFITTTGRS